MQAGRGRDLDAAEPEPVAGPKGVNVGREPRSNLAGVRLAGVLAPPPSTAQPCRGWAKTIRPATVWRTRVTVTSTSVSIDFAPPSTTTIVPSSR